MRQAMATLKQFSDKDRAYDRYQARQNYLREQRTIQWEIEQMKAEKDTAIEREAKANEAQAREKESVALNEIKHLKALLNKKNKEIFFLYSVYDMESNLI
jgi:hypothetical protein